MAFLYWDLIYCLIEAILKEKQFRSSFAFEMVWENKH